MSDEVTVICDRCGKVVDGLHNAEIGMTAGYYNTAGLPWSKYADVDELIICDACMWTDARYLKDYGPQLPVATKDRPND